MNKKLLAIAIGTAVSLPVVALAEGPTVYGKMNLTLEQNKVDPAPAAPENDTKIVLDSNDSRLGVKGDFDLDGGLKAIYQAEFGIYVDDGNSSGQTFTQRNIFAGIEGGFGTFQAGMFDTPTKKAQGKIDQFGDLDGDIKHILAGEVRAANIVQYSTPKLADAFTVNVALIPNEDTNDFDGNGENENGLADTTSFSLVYEGGPFYAAASHDTDLVDSLEADDTGTSETVDLTRLVAGFKADAIELGALYQMAEETEGDGEDASLVVSGAYSIDRVKLKVQYGQTEGDVSDETLTTTSFGADYKLAKASKVFAYVTKVEADNADTTEDYVAVGMEHKF